MGIGEIVRAPCGTEKKKLRRILKWSVITLVTYWQKTLRSNYFNVFSFTAVHTFFCCKSYHSQRWDKTGTKWGIFNHCIEQKTKYVTGDTDAIAFISFLFLFSLFVSHLLLFCVVYFTQPKKATYHNYLGISVLS